MSEHEVIADLLANILYEQRITTERIASLAHAIAHAGQGSPAVQAEAAKVIEKAKEVPAAPKPDAPTAAVPAPSAPVETTAESPSEVSYNSLSAAVLAAVKKDRTGVLALFAKLGVKSAKELQPAQYAKVLAQVEAI